MDALLTEMAILIAQYAYCKGLVRAICKGVSNF